MGNIMKRNPPVDQQGAMYPPYQQQQQPQFAPQAQYAPQPQYAQQPIMPQSPQFVQQPHFAPQQPQFAPQPPPQYRPPSFPQQQGSFRPSYSGGPYMSHYPGSPASALSLPNSQNPSSYYENDSFLANLTGWSVQDIERLRHEFFSYANSYGVIDRESFRKLYIASLLNMTWEAVEHDAEAAFRNFDINQTGTLDFNEYITACARLTREVQVPYSSPPPMSPSYIY